MELKSKIMNFIDRYLNKHILFEIAPVLIFFTVNYIWGLTYAIVAIMFALIVFAGLRLRPCLLARALEGQVYLSDNGWRILTFRWIFFALFLAITNEIVWRTQNTDTWVAFKTILSLISIFGSIVITRITAPIYWQEPETRF